MAPVPAFVRAVLHGAVAAAAPMLVITLVMEVISMFDLGRPGGNLWPSLYLMALPLIVTLPLVLAASLLIGLPLTILLKRTDRESERAYMACGAVAGFLIPIVGLLAMAAPSGYWVALLGAFGGAITGRTWWSAARQPQRLADERARSADGGETLP